MAARVRGALLEAIDDMLAREVLGSWAGTAVGDRAAGPGGQHRHAGPADWTGRGGDLLLDLANGPAAVEVRPGDPAAWAAAWQLPNADIVVLPPLGGFVGSDLLAAAVATGLLEGPAGSLLLDARTEHRARPVDGRPSTSPRCRADRPSRRQAHGAAWPPGPGPSPGWSRSRLAAMPSPLPAAPRSGASAAPA